MTNREAFYIIGNIPIPIDDENYDICQYQEAKAIALDCIDKVDKINEVLMELEEELTLADKEKERCAKENPLQFDNAKGYANGISNAIDLIKNKLGVSEDD